MIHQLLIGSGDGQMTASFSTSRLAFVDSKLVGTKLGKYLAHLPDGEDDPHGGPAEDVAHVHDGGLQDPLSLISAPS